MSDRRDSEGPRRPLLAHGERLKHAATRPRGPNEKFHPVSHVEAWRALSPKAHAMQVTLDRLPAEVMGRHIVFEATLLPNYLASSYFPQRALDEDGLYVVGARTARATKVTEKQELPDQLTRTLIIAGDPDGVRRFARKMSARPSESNARTWDELRRFGEVTLPLKDSVIVRRPPGPETEPITFEAVLTHVYDRPESEAQWADLHFKRFTTWVAKLGGVVDVGFRRDLRGLSFVPVLARPAVLDRIAEFNLLRAIRPMPVFAPFPEEMMRVAASPPSLSEAAVAGNVPTGVVAVFDGGVDATLPVFYPFVSSYDLTTAPPATNALRHGSMVTSALLYGPLVPGAQLPDPTTVIDHYRVFPLPPLPAGKPDHRLYEMVDRITDTIRKEDYEMVVLSMGPNEPIEDDVEPDRFTAELDLLAEERRVTFVTAVGNNGEEDSALGYDRVQPPADMVNGIGVGAITSNTREAKKRWVRAPYSAIGPGREGQRVQPTVVEFGGAPEEPFIGFDERGRLVRAWGTSFAAPTVGRALAELSSALGTVRRTPEVLRAFTVHHAERKHGHGKHYLDLGYGRSPASFQPAFECPAHEVTVLYEDTLPRGEVSALRFPFPHGLHDDVKLELTWTLSYLSEVDPRASTDYTLAGIEAIFRPDFRVRSLTDPSSKQSQEVRTDLDTRRIAAALARGHTLSSEPKAHSQWLLTKGEQRLRRDGKWETLVPGRVLATAGELFEPRLDVQYLRREGGRLVGRTGVDALKFAMLLTIRAPQGVDLYDLVAAQYRVLVPLISLPVRLSGVA